ncbi:sensor histidine kinase [Nocardia flavorosea]|uniref:ATP-binding protein n=1 Tax=Nocardia flavorosea TaxID=53429 RepID=A0A846YQN3_9NOCA|nr:ATP-binding protein [Nocardia flavorosea]NKY59678.1 ATP-binding protein [Nocardia flavorosea]
MSATTPAAVPRRPALWLRRPRELWSVAVSLVRMRNATPELAADRVVRRFGLVIGLVGTIAAVLELPEIIVQHRAVPLIWTTITFAVAFGMLPVLAVVSLVAGARLVRAVAGAAALGYLAGMALVMPYYYEIAEAPGLIWAHRLVMIGVLAAAVAWRSWLSVGYLVVTAATPGVALYVMFDDTTVLSVVENITRNAGLCLLFLWCVVHARAAGARVDRESVVAGDRAAAVAGTVARERERARFAVLIHDAVLSTLLDASRSGSTGTSAVLRQQARRTLDQLDATRLFGADTGLLDASSAVGFLRAAVHEVNAGIEFTVHRGGNDSELRMPLSAAGPLAAALAEAVRNSLRHAGVPGRRVRREVTATVGAGGLLLVFQDDGAGFDRSAVPADRLGISASILGRMRQLPGGAGFVESEPGQGTTVTLMWANAGSVDDDREK